MNNETKATVATGGAGIIVPYLAALAAGKWGIPLEVAAVVVGGIFAFVGRWAGKLIPSHVTQK